MKSRTENNVNGVNGVNDELRTLVEAFSMARFDAGRYLGTERADETYARCDQAERALFDRLDELQAELAAAQSSLERLRNLDAALREYVTSKSDGPTEVVRELKRTGAWTGLAESLAEKLGQARRTERELRTQLAESRAAFQSSEAQLKGTVEAIPIIVETQLARQRQGLDCDVRRTLFDPPQAPRREPRAVLQYRGVRVELTLTMVHHLIECRGWGAAPSVSAYAEQDRSLQEVMEEIERRMWVEHALAPGPEETA